MENKRIANNQPTFKTRSPAQYVSTIPPYHKIVWTEVINRYFPNGGVFTGVFYELVSGYWRKISNALEDDCVMSLDLIIEDYGVPCLLDAANE